MSLITLLLGILSSVAPLIGVSVPEPEPAAAVLPVRELVLEPCVERELDAREEERMMVEVDRETVGQYTGLTDRNGKRIFEGDIVRDVDTGNIRTVEYHGNRFVFVSLLRHFFDVIYEEDWEVIGNIHDNPETVEEVV